MKTPSETFKKATECVNKAFRQQITPRSTKRLALEILIQIRKRTRLGFGVTQGAADTETVVFPGKQERFRKLEEVTRDLRKKFQKNLSNKTTPRRSNLTATGQLLDSMRPKGKVARAVVGIDDRRGPDLDGSVSGKGNSQIIEDLERQGRTFFALSKSELRRFERKIAQKIERKAIECFRG